MGKCAIHPDTDLTTSGCFRCWQKQQTIFQPVIDSETKIFEAIKLLKDETLSAPNKCHRVLILLEHNFR
jgi:hypothetical protein